MQEITHTLQIKRYTTQELINFITNEFYKSLGVNTTINFMQQQVQINAIMPRLLFNQRKQQIQNIKYRLKDLKVRLKQEEALHTNAINIYKQGIAITKTMLNLYENWDIATQKATCNKLHNILSTHAFIEVPLNKKINGLYDEFNALIFYYDNISSNEEIISTLENAPTLTEKMQLIKENTEITHILLSLNNNSRANIALMGNIKAKASNIKANETTTLPAKFSDFTTLTLQDCESIKNNDLAQMVQERIDMDKENLIKLAHLTIKGEEYQVFKSPYTNKEYIRYICPSTQRVYYNLLNHTYLSTSKYYKKGDAESYIKAWYSIANLFMELTEEEIAKPSIAC